MQKKNETAAKVKRAVSEPIVAKARPAHPPPPAIYALRIWSVKKLNGKWYISPAARFDDKPQ